MNRAIHDELESPGRSRIMEQAFDILSDKRSMRSITLGDLLLEKLACSFYINEKRTVSYLWQGCKAWIQRPNQDSMRRGAGSLPGIHSGRYARNWRVTTLPQPFF